MMVSKMRDSVPRARYSPVCNALRLRMCLMYCVPTYCVYRLYKNEKHFLNEQRSSNAAAPKRANTSGVGKINNYCEDIYIPPYNNTH